jgi:hypothetical protein
LTQIGIFGLKRNHLATLVRTNKNLATLLHAKLFLPPTKKPLLDVRLKAIKRGLVGFGQT